MNVSDFQDLFENMHYKTLRRVVKTLKTMTEFDNKKHFNRVMNLNTNVIFDAFLADGILEKRLNQTTHRFEYCLNHDKYPTMVLIPPDFTWLESKVFTPEDLKQLDLTKYYYMVLRKKEEETNETNV